MPIQNTEMILRLLIAAFLGASIGFERERRGQPAGLRTHTILSLGAALAMLLSVSLSTPRFDPARLAAQVISGIGFLGAGAILRYGMSIKGLTTATSLWTVAIVGLAVGAGYYLPALVAAGILLVALVILDGFEERFLYNSFMSVVITASPREGFLLERMKERLEEARLMVAIDSLTFDKDSESLTVTCTIRSRQREENRQRLLAQITALEGVQQVTVS